MSNTMTKRLVKAGNTMMIQRIRLLPAQTYQEGKGVFRVVETRGRRSGQLRYVPLAVALWHGQKYLISPEHTRDWVKNLLASDECTLIAGKEREHCHATLTLDEEAIAIVKAYIASLPDWALQQFPFSAHASTEEILSKQDKFAVFRLSE